MRLYLYVVVLTAVVLSSSPANASEPRPLVFGLNIGMSDRECELAKQAGCTSVRIGCGWDLVEREPGKYDFSDPDRDVAQCIKYGFEPFFLIVATPPFYLEEHMRDKPWGWPALPEYYPQAEKFYRTLAERYKGKVKYYEFWNEENGYSWHAINKPEEYAPILKVAYKALKQGDPDCLVAGIPSRFPVVAIAPGENLPLGGKDGCACKKTKQERHKEAGCPVHNASFSLDVSPANSLATE